MTFFSSYAMIKFSKTKTNKRSFKDSSGNLENNPGR